MKISFFLFTDIRTGRGTENVVLNLVKYKPQDVSISIVQTDLFDRIRLSEEYVRGITEQCEVIKFHTNNPFPPNFTTIYAIYLYLIKRPIHKDLKSLKNTSTLEKIRSADIVYLLYNMYAVFFDRTDVPIISSEHTGFFPNWLKKANFLTMIPRKFFYKIYYKNINGLHVFPANKNIFDKINVKYKMILSNGIDTRIFYPNYDIKNNKIKFLFVASLVLKKGLDILLPLIERIKDDSLEFHIAGTGPLEDEIRKNKRIIYHGALNADDLARLYRECDVFIYPSHADSFPLVVLEALSSGLYVLAGDYLRGNFDDFEGKYLEYIPMNVDSFHKRVMDIVGDRKTIERDKREEYVYVKKNYDWSVIAERFYGYMREFYEENKKE